MVNMADTAGKKGKKKKGKTLNLNAFLSEGGKAPVIVPAAKSSWADEMEDTGASEWGDDTFNSRQPAFDVTKLPTAPAASLDSSVDPSRLPTSPPFTAYIGSLPYDVTEDEIADFFDGLKLLSIRLPTGIRQKGFGYAEFEDLESLKGALALNNETIQNRQIKVDVAGHSSHGSGFRDGDRGQGDNYSMADAMRTNRDWRQKDSGGGGFDGGSQPSDRWSDNRESSDRYSSRNDYGSGGFTRQGPGDDSRGFGRSDRGFGRDDDRGSGRDDRGFGGGDRGFGGGDRGFGGGDRGFGSGDRGFGGGDRGFGGGDRGFGSGDRGGRGFNRSDRGDDRNGYGGQSRNFCSEDSSQANGNAPADEGNWRSKMAPAVQPPTTERAAIPAAATTVRNDHARSDQSAAAPSGPKERKKLNLKPRSVTSNAPQDSNSSSIFGGARPVDTSTKEKEIEERLAKMKVEAETKPKQHIKERRDSQNAISNDDDKAHSSHRQKNSNRKPRTSSRGNSENENTPKDTTKDVALQSDDPKEVPIKHKKGKGAASKYEEPKAPVFTTQSIYSVLATDENSDNDENVTDDDNEQKN